MTKTVFETETCGRCGGGGRYSYNAMHGSTCYGCGGSGIRLTKRGAVARAAYLESCKIALRDVVVGDVISFGGVTFGGDVYTRKAAVARIEHGVQRWMQDADTEWRERPTITVWNAKNEGESGNPDTMVRKYWPAEINAVKVADALALQATLGKSGKPLARKAA